MSFTRQLEFCKHIALAAGEVVRQEREAGPLHQFKHHSELVTSADLKADRLISEAIRAQWPGHRLVSEESAPELVPEALRTQPCWIVDPIDGTVNFAHGHNQSAVSIAYAEGAEVRAGVVYNPFTEELFWAQQGGGAWCNDRRIQVGKESDLTRTIVATGFPYQKLQAEMELALARLRAVLTHCADIRRLGAASLDICWVAMGRLDGYYENLSVWDFAAAQLVAVEAGARFGHFQPVPAGIPPAFHARHILVANPVLFPQLQQLLQAADRSVAAG